MQLDRVYTIYDTMSKSSSNKRFVSIFTICFTLLVTTIVAEKLGADHSAKVLSSSELLQVASLTNIKHMYDVELDPLLIERVPGTTGSQQARNHIIQRLETIGGWQVVQDAFTAETPYGKKEFVNIIATLNPTTARRLVLACHYDSKYFAGFTFIGATDAAVPCAMLLDLAYSLNDILKANSLEEVTLQFIFFDGNEAFLKWTEHDSLYGSRHLANLWKNTYNLSGSGHAISDLERIDMLVLLNLIGESKPRFHDYFAETSTWFQHMQNVENRLSAHDLLQRQTNSGTKYFVSGDLYRHNLQDDHGPFVDKGIPCFLINPLPFPKYWHMEKDNKDALDKDTIHDLNKMLQVFTTEYLHLNLPATE